MSMVKWLFGVKLPNVCIIACLILLPTWLLILLLVLTMKKKFQASYIEGQERGIFDALYGSQRRQLKDGAPLVISDKAIEMALTDIVNGGKDALCLW